MKYETVHEWWDDHKCVVLSAYPCFMEMFPDGSTVVEFDILDAKNEKYQSHYVVPREIYEELLEFKSMYEGLQK